MEERLIVGITGASGSIYALQFVKRLKEEGKPFEVIITDAGKVVWEYELDLSWHILKDFAERVFEESEIGAPPASGSSPYWGMVVIPCSMGTLAGLATGISRNLLLRAGDVMLKEQKPLILVVRETPLNLIHLQNMLNIIQAGGVIFPAMPGFYHKPKTLEELIDNFIERLLNFMSLCKKNKPWKGLNF